MIQRRQSLYLFIAVIFAFIYFFSSPQIASISGQVKDTNTNETLRLNYTETAYIDQQNNIVGEASSNDYLKFTLLIIGIMGLLTIFLFKQRKLQLRLAAYLIMFDLLLIFLVFFQHHTATKLFATYETSWQYFAFLPFILPVLHLLALRGIVHDIKLLQAVDRLR